MSRIHLLPVFRHKLNDGAAGSRPAVLVRRSGLRHQAHIHDVGITAPGTMDQLQEIVSRIVAKPLDRSRPLWEMAVINGLEGGKTAVVVTPCTIR